MKTPKLTSIEPKLVPSQSLIDALEKILECARTGSLTSFVAVGQHNDGYITQCHYVTKAACPVTLLGLITIEAHRIVNDGSLAVSNRGKA